jgi:hypothetical protein
MVDNRLRIVGVRRRETTQDEAIDSNKISYPRKKKTSDYMKVDIASDEMMQCIGP